MSDAQRIVFLENYIRQIFGDLEDAKNKDLKEVVGEVLYNITSTSEGFGDPDTKFLTGRIF